MMKRTALLVLLFAAVASADVVWKNAGVTKGPVTSINCQADAGLSCDRDAGMMGNLRCNVATATETGCLIPSAQTLGGDKTWTGSQRISPVAHGSLETCDGAHVGLKQVCSTHNAEVFCNGTTNIEYSGASATERTLFSVYVNGIPIGTMDATQLSSTAGATVAAIGASWVSGTTGDGGVLTFRITDGSNNCDCSVACAAPAARTSCSGTCSFAASATLTPARVSVSGCLKDPVALGNVQVLGTSP